MAKCNSLPLTHWPQSDRLAWDAACIQGERLKRGGTASHLKLVTQKDLQRRYSYLLDFCKRTGRLDISLAAAGHVTRPIVNKFIEDLQPRVSSVTLAQTIYKIRRFANLIAPETDLEWLREIERDLAFEMKPRPRHHRVVNARLIVEVALTEMGRTDHLACAGSKKAAVGYRNALIVALLACCPIRLKSLTSLKIGKELYQLNESGEWWLSLEASQTKTGRVDERPIPGFLAEPINNWLIMRKAILVGTDDALWVGLYGRPLGYSALERAICNTTTRLIGHSINPHLFRDCGVHLIASEAGHSMGLASALLQHRDPRTTEAHYNRGATLEAAEAYSCILDLFVGDKRSTEFT